jgi:ubiquitin-conjugating enzyme E2 J2
MQAAATRLRKELKKLHDDPIPQLIARPREDNILEWRFLIKGNNDKDSPYAGGCYMGKLVFPPQYPWKPPAVHMCTPSGRFETGRRICLSISDYHPESWVPSWTVGTILLGVISFFHQTDSTLGSMDTTNEAKREYALKSIEFNAKDKVFKEMYGSDGTAAEAFAVADAQIEKKKGKKVAAAAASSTGESVGKEVQVESVFTAPTAAVAEVPAAKVAAAVSTSEPAATATASPKKNKAKGAANSGCELS